MITVFTPSHNPAWLDDCERSLRAQTFTDWEWVVLLNGDAHWAPAHLDRHIRVQRATVTGVGDAKRRACRLARGDILVELDHDDVLTPDALEKVAQAFAENPQAGFVYSNWAYVTDELEADESPEAIHPASQGWEIREIEKDGRRLLAHTAMAPLPHNVSYIWWAPNHLRAFRRSYYELAGGYDASRDVLDDQELMGRLYRVTWFHHIDECLYLQRRHSANTQIDPEINPRIQRETVVLYDEQAERNALSWAHRNELKALDLGAAHNKTPGYLGVDQHAGDTVDLHGDIFDVLGSFDDSSVGVIRAVDFIEHIPDKIRLFNEMHRVFAHGGMFLSLTPSTDGRGAYQDPTHVAFYNENAFWYFTDPQFAQYVPEIKCRFQVSRLVTYFPTDWHAANQISYVCANLIAVKDGPRLGGILQWEPEDLLP